MIYQQFNNVKIRGLGKQTMVEFFDDGGLKWFSFSFVASNGIKVSVNTDGDCKVFTVYHGIKSVYENDTLFYRGVTKPFENFHFEKVVNAQLKKYCTAIERCLDNYNHSFDKVLSHLTKYHTETKIYY